MDTVVTEEEVEFVRHLQDQTVTEIPSVVTLECELSKANVKVQWQRAGQPVTRGAKYDFSADGTVHRMTIRDLHGDDISEYMAIARGKMSKCSLSIQGMSAFWCLFSAQVNYVLLSRDHPSYVTSKSLAMGVVA